ncbi:MAG: HEAT repeat domain-containing protein [Candidatus Sericytochromatia bacterium]
MEGVNKVGQGHALVPKWRLFSQAPQAPTGGSGMAFDQLNLVGGNAPAGQSQDQYSQFVADTIAMLDSPDARQRFQAIVNMTKMNPQEAVPLLQRAVQNDNQQVRELAQRALTVMQQMPAGQQPQAQAPGAQPPQPSAYNFQAPANPVVAADKDLTTADLYFLTDTIKNGTEAEQINAILSLEPHAAKNPQAVLSVLYPRLDPSDSSNIRLEKSMLAAISVLAKSKSPQVVPYLQQIVGTSYMSDQIKQAAAQAIGEIQGQDGAEAGSAQIQSLAAKIEHGSEAEQIDAILRLEAFVQKNPVEVLRALHPRLNMANSSNMRLERAVQAAISVAGKINHPSVAPFLDHIIATSYVSRSVKSAAMAAKQSSGQLQPAQVQTQVQPQGAPVQQPAQQPAQQQGNGIPGFLQR